VIFIIDDRGLRPLILFLKSVSVRSVKEKSAKAREGNKIDQL
jgi:hypothetical protein